MTDSFTIPRVTATGASLDNFNNPLNQIQKALNQLADNQAQIYNKSAIILFDQPVLHAAKAGDLVYYDVDEAAFAPAIAQLNAELGQQGQTMQSPKARVMGMLISDPAVQGSSYVATILFGGMYHDQSGSLITHCLGQNAMPGTYYLSPWTAGKAVLDPKQNLRQPVLQYMGDGKFALSCFYLAHDGHQHASVTLTYTYWAQDVEQNKYTYDPEGKDSVYVALGQLSQATTALFVDGKLHTWGQVFSIDPYRGLCATQLPDASAKIVLMNHYPLAYGAPVVRDVVSSAAWLTTHKKGGIVQITPVPYTYSTEDAGKGSAIYDITGSEIVRHKVVNEIVAGIGIDVHTKAGTVTVTNKALDSIYADATLINLNGAVHIEQSGLTFIVFPAGRQTTVNMYYPVNYIQDAAKATVWMQYSTQTAAEASVSLSYIQLPDTKDTQVEILQPWQLQTLTLAAVSAGKLRLAQTEPMSITKPGYLCASIKITPTNNVKLIRQGFRVATEV